MVSECGPVEEAGSGDPQNKIGREPLTDHGQQRRLVFSDHFVRQWQAYFGTRPPSINHVLCLIGRAIWIDRNKLLYEEDGTPHKQLGTYWVPERNIILKVDWDKCKVVTVITPMSRRGDRKGREPWSVQREP